MCNILTTEYSFQYNFVTILFCNWGQMHLPRLNQGTSNSKGSCYPFATLFYFCSGPVLLQQHNYYFLITSRDAKIIDTKKCLFQQQTMSALFIYYMHFLCLLEFQNLTTTNCNQLQRSYYIVDLSHHSLSSVSRFALLLPSVSRICR